MISIIEIQTRIGGDDEGRTIVWERAAFNYKGKLFIERVSREFTVWVPKYILIKYLRIEDCLRPRRIRTIPE